MKAQPDIEQNHSLQPTALNPAERNSRPIWELFEESVADLPEEILAKLPTDGAEQHDHYIYGTPKRPS